MLTEAAMLGPAYSVDSETVHRLHPGRRGAVVVQGLRQCASRGKADSNAPGEGVPVARQDATHRYGVSQGKPLKDTRVRGCDARAGL
jgi:hypothetical protein